MRRSHRSIALLGLNALTDYRCRSRLRSRRDGTQIEHVHLPNHEVHGPLIRPLGR